MTRYFSLNETGRNHVGTILLNSTSNKEFTEKVKSALESHFDTDIYICELNFHNYTNGKGGILKVNVDGCEYDVYICETWIY